MRYAASTSKLVEVNERLSVPCTRAMHPQSSWSSVSESDGLSLIETAIVSSGDKRECFDNNLSAH